MLYFLKQYLVGNWENIPSDVFFLAQLAGGAGARESIDHCNVSLPMLSPANSKQVAKSVNDDQTTRVQNVDFFLKNVSQYTYDWTANAISSSAYSI